jgi:glyoxylase-like metal-dependent hydrolase (beta-lactamase superfamily II)
MSLLSPLYPRGPIDLRPRLRALPAEGLSPVELGELPGWQILHTPGHTPGHVSFFRPQDKTLLVGDAFCTTKPESFFEAALAQQVEMHGPPAYFTPDWNSARESVRRFAEPPARDCCSRSRKSSGGTQCGGSASNFSVEFRSNCGARE